MSLSRDRFPAPIVREKGLAILMSSDGLQNLVNNSEVRDLLLKKLWRGDLYYLYAIRHIVQRSLVA